MKKNLIALAVALFTIHAVFAQTEKGHQTLGLNIGYLYSKSTSGAGSTIPANVTYTQKTVNFYIGPSYSCFIVNNLDFGINLTYSNGSNESLFSYINKQNTNSIGGNVFVRKYVLYNNKIGFRTGARLGYTHDNYDYNYSALNDTKYSGSTAYGGLLFDLVYYPTNKIGLAANMINATYTHQHAADGTINSNSSDVFSFNFINTGLQISAYYSFGGK